ncbi:MAG: DUF116 domain-containing protein [Bacteroidia bacterium]|nr:DUF116 domain-containing protein [Bacteroidia bacterium]
MKSSRPEYTPVNGKTYSLFGKSDSTAGYYETIRQLADKVLALNPVTRELVEGIRNFSLRKKLLKKSLGINDAGNKMPVILNLIDPCLKKYTENVEGHLRTLPLSKIWDRRLATTREQYHLYMLEIELTNRLFRTEFINANKKIALLPYCLRDFSASCKAAKNGFDYQCKHCSAKCFQNHTSEILKSHNIEPYIWMGGNMKQLAKYTFHEKRTFGILGIACVPELTFGMRSCRKNNIPVVGLPINANRCIRWFGEFFQNSVDLDELEKLVKNY